MYTFCKRQLIQVYIKSKMGKCYSITGPGLAVSYFLQLFPVSYALCYIPLSGFYLTSQSLVKQVSKRKHLLNFRVISYCWLLARELNRNYLYFLSIPGCCAYTLESLKYSTAIIHWIYPGLGTCCGWHHLLWSCDSKAGGAAWHFMEQIKKC